MSGDNSRISLVPSSPEHLLALIDGEDRFTALVGGVGVAPGLREFFVSGEVSPEWVASLRQAHGVDPWRYGFFIVDRSRNLAIGSAGFKGPPDDEGSVEIAYGVVQTHQGRGYATEAARALIAFAQEKGRATVIRAHTLPERNASTRVLEKCGFSHVGMVVDPDDGPVWRWERSSTAESGGTV